MPSSHSATTACLAVLIGKGEGFGSPLFAMSLILAAVVMHDAFGVRRAAGQQATVLNKMIKKEEFKDIEVEEELVEDLGHTPKQVLVGALIGIIVGIIF